MTLTKLYNKFKRLQSEYQYRQENPDFFPSERAISGASIRMDEYGNPINASSSLGQEGYDDNLKIRERAYNYFIKKSGSTNPQDVYRAMRNVLDNAGTDKFDYDEYNMARQFLIAKGNIDATRKTPASDLLTAKDPYFSDDYVKRADAYDIANMDSLYKKNMQWP